MPDEQIADWPRQVVEPYREGLLRRWDSLTERIEAADGEWDELAEKTRPEIESLAAKVPELGEEPTEIEYLTMRAAQADVDLAEVQRDVALEDLHLKVQKLVLERCEVGLRAGQVDHVIEEGVQAVGNDDQLAILMLRVRESSLELASATAAVDLYRQRLTLTKRMHRDVHAALRKLDRAAGQGKK
jgi:hypothetical protein